jgi:hypothetical protein
VGRGMFGNCGIVIPNAANKAIIGAIILGGFGTSIVGKLHKLIFILLNQT